MQRGLEWAAGLFEGEGYVCLNRDDHLKYAYAGLDMTDESEVEEFARIIGVGNITSQHRKNRDHKVIHCWRTGRREDVEHTMLMLAPWLGQRRLVQAVNALAADTRKGS